MRYYIIAGEASGDLHGSNLIRAIKARDKDASIRSWGGEKMQAAGAEVVKHYRELAFMGFVEVIRNLPAIMRNLANCKKDIAAYRPDVIVLIDYPGFNMRIAGWAHDQGFRIAYYISPQVWAWKENRVKSIRKYVDRMLVILPFEKDFYQKWNYDVQYVGHPLVQAVDEFRESPAPLSIDGDQIIALLPGSRKQEISVKLPIMLRTAKHFPDYTFVVAKAPGLDQTFYDSLLVGYDNVQTVSNQTYPLLSRAKAALVTSGTATLETALFGVPEIICYKGSAISYQIAKRLISIKYIGLVNLIMDKPVVKELIQDELNETNLVAELKLILFDEKVRARIHADYTALKTLLSEGGHASDQAAASVIELAAGLPQ